MLVRSLVLLSLALAGCGGAISASIAHPARVGTIPPHALVRPDRNAEGTGFGARFAAAATNTSTRRLPPGALDDAIRLVRFDERGVCFDLLSRHTEPTSIDFRSGIDARLVAQPGGQPVAGRAMVVASEPRGHTEVAQTDVAVQDGWSSGCDGDGCWSQPTYTTETQNIGAAVYVSRALFCFANDGSFTPSTESIELSLPHARFRWSFDAPGAAWSSPVITMEPVYVGPTDELLRMAAPVAAIEPRS